MPFIVTTKRPDGDDRACDCHIPELEGAGQHSPGCECFKAHPVSRRAVATLEETRARSYSLLDRGLDRDGRARNETWHAVDRAIRVLPESGGTVGPLPDGTVIDVERKTWGELADLAGWLDDHAPVITTAAERASILDAFNAREQAR